MEKKRLTRYKESHMPKKPSLPKPLFSLGIFLACSFLICAFMSIGGVWNDYSVRQHYMEKAYAAAFHRLLPVYSVERGGSTAEAEAALEGFFNEHSGGFVALYAVDRESGHPVVDKEPVFFMHSPAFPPELAVAMRKHLQGHLNHMMVPYVSPNAAEPGRLLTIRGFGPDAMYGLSVGVPEPLPKVTFLDLYPPNLIRSILLMVAFSSMIWLLRPLRRAVGRMINALYDGSPAGDANLNNAHSAADLAARSLQGNVDAADSLLVLNAEREIVLCSKAMMEAFVMLDNPSGFAFSAVFGPDAERPQNSPGGVYSQSFYTAVSQPGGPVSAEVSLEKNGHVERYYLIVFSLELEGELFAVCILKHVEALPSFDGALQEMRQTLEETVQEQNVELKRINAQLRIENSERSAVVHALRRAESRYRDIFDNATEGIFQWTPGWKLLTSNRSFASMMGYSTVNHLLHSFSERSFRFCCSENVAEDLVAKLEEKGHVSNFELQVIRQDGVPLWASMNARRVVGQSGITIYYEAFIENIADRKSTEEKLLYQAFHDPLTGLANRALFLDRLKMAIRRSSRQPEHKFTVLYLDLDRFKVVNDSFGHNTGDEVLCNAAINIVSCVREIDTVARFGGDEFAVLIEHTERPSMAIRVAKRIYTTLNEPFFIDGQEINIGASVGVLLHAQKYDQAEDILRDADTAMYHAKAGQNTFMRVFSQKMRVDTLASIALEADLRQGVKNDEFFMEYQPIVHMADGSLHGFEALIRWNRREQVVGPADFIPVAEETGLIKGLGLYTIERVCQRIVEWRKACADPFVMHVNISGRQLVFPSFPREVQRIIEHTGVDPKFLRFEITESVFLDNGRACIIGIQQIRELGVHFCLDDFGTGFSSLSYLRRLPLDSIKLDRSFMLEIENDPLSLAIVRNLVCLGNDLGLSVVVEGIERETQVECLMDAGCMLAQGYFFHRPMNTDLAARLLHEGKGALDGAR